MKIRYLGFLPAIIVILVSHYVLITDLIKAQTEKYYFVNPIAGGTVIVFWLWIMIFGIMWAMSE